MNKYKSLLYRSLKIMRKNLISYFGLIAAMTAMPFLFVIINREDLTASDDVKNFVGMLCMFLAFLAAFLFSVDDTVRKADKNSNWSVYTVTLPVSALDRTLTYFSIKLVLALCGGAICAAAAAILGNMLDITILSGVLTIYFIAFSVSMLFSSLYSAAAKFIAGSEDDSRTKRIVTTIEVTLTAFLLLAAGYQIDIPALSKQEIDGQIFEMILDKTSPYLGVSMLIFTAAFAAVFFITLNSSKRREA